MNGLDEIVREEIENCPYCKEVVDKPVGQTLCGKTKNDLVCSRIKDHEGIHAACGQLKHPIQIWL